MSLRLFCLLIRDDDDVDDGDDDDDDKKLTKSQFSPTHASTKRKMYHPALCFSSSVIFLLVDACVGLNLLLVSFLSHVNKNIIHSFIDDDGDEMLMYCVESAAADS